MASGKVARRTAVGDVAELLDSPEISALIEELEALRWTGARALALALSSALASSRLCSTSRPGRGWRR